jgi:hypothetical protein
MAVRVGSTQLTNVSVQGETGAIGTLPSGVEPGTYDVIIQQGADMAVYPSGFTVTAGDGGDGGLLLTQITPSTGRRGESIAVTLEGSGFDAEVSFSLGGVFLDDAVIQSVSVVTATVPGTLPVGTHAVVAARGDEQSILSPGFEVTGDGGSSSDGCSTVPGAGTGAGALGLIALLLAVRRRALV